MTTIGFARPPWLGEEPAVSTPGSYDPLAIASAALGVLAVATFVVESVDFLCLPACAVSIGLALAAWRRSRAASRPVGLTAWAGILLSIVAAVGLTVAPAAFGSTGTSSAPPPNPAAGSVAVPDGDASTAQVVSRDITVTFGAPHTELDNTGLVMATVPVSVQNITDHTASYNLVFEARDATNQVITTDSAFVPNVAPGQIAQVRVFNIVNSTLVPKLMTAHYDVSQASVQ
jgi:hypothetical protein